MTYRLSPTGGEHCVLRMLQQPMWKPLWTVTFTESPTDGMGGSIKICAAAATPAWIATPARRANASERIERMFQLLSAISGTRPTGLEANAGTPSVGSPFRVPQSACALTRGICLRSARAAAAGTDRDLPMPTSTSARRLAAIALPLGLLAACAPRPTGTPWARVLESTPAFLAGTTAADPSLAVDRGGRVALTWVTRDSTGATDAWLSVSADSGLHWSQPARLNVVPGM